VLDFYRTAAGRTYFDATLPAIVREIARLNDALERVVALLEEAPTGRPRKDVGRRRRATVGRAPAGR